MPLFYHLWNTAKHAKYLHVLCHFVVIAKQIITCCWRQTCFCLIFMQDRAPFRRRLQWPAFRRRLHRAPFRRRLQWPAFRRRLQWPAFRRRLQWPAFRRRFHRAPFRRRLHRPAIRRRLHRTTFRSICSIWLINAQNLRRSLLPKLPAKRTVLRTPIASIPKNVASSLPTSKPAWQSSNEVSYPSGMHLTYFILCRTISFFCTLDCQFLFLCPTFVNPGLVAVGHRVSGGLWAAPRERWPSVAWEPPPA